MNRILKGYILAFIPFVLPVWGQTTDLEKQLETIRNAYVVPGISAAIYVDGKLVEHGVAGIRKIGFSEPISRENKFHLGSCTKSMTATIAATFVEEGKLKWSDTLSTLLPKHSIHQKLQNVTFQMLLAHQSGIIKDPDNDLYEELEKLETSKGRSELTRIFLEQKPFYEVDTYHYSNIAYIIAGNILEELSGKSWETLIQERLFIPLGMKSCDFGPTSILNEEKPSEPWGHYIRNLVIKSIHGDNAPFYGPAANVHCSTDDWVKYLSVHLNGFNKESTFLKEESFQYLHTLYPKNNPDHYTSGGWFRLQRDWANGDVLHHTGTNTYNYATVWMAPKTKTILVSNTNRSGPSGSWATSDAIVEMIRLFISKK